MTDQHPPDQPAYPSYRHPGSATGALPVGYPAPPTGTPQPLGVLTGVAMAIPIVWIGVAVLSTLMSWQAKNDYLDAAHDGRPGWDTFTAYDILALLTLPAIIAAYVVTGLWLYRARVNTDLLSATPQARSRGWVWGGWICPIVNLWFPFQIVRDTLRVRTHHPAAGPLVGWWWGLWLTATVFSWIEGFFVPGGDTIDTDLVGMIPAMSVIHTILLTATGLLWLRIVRAIDRDQESQLAQAGIAAM